MRMLQYLFAAATALAFWAGLSLLPGCANMIPPTGGPRDSLPPELLRAYPDNGSTGFNRSSITLQFNEYVQLSDLQQQLLINPPPDRQPEIRSNLRTMSIKLKDSLMPNTTYALQFGDAIRDVNENNPLRNFTYVFSTGSFIDSLTVGGQVLNAETGLPDSTMLVILHVKNEDSTVAKEKPRFATKPNGKGEFEFGFLPPGEFYLYALKDEGLKRYTSPLTPFAFYDGAVRSSTSDTAYTLRAFVAEKEKPKENKASAATPGTNRRKEDKGIKVTTGTPNGDVDLLDSFFLSLSQPTAALDAGKLRLTDTNYNPINGWSLRLDTLQRRAYLLYAWKPEMQYRLVVGRGFASDTAGGINVSTDTLDLKVKAQSDYGRVNLQLSNVDMDKRPVLQWVQNGDVVQSLRITGRTLRLPLFRPGEYQLRLLYDDNGNGLYDPGNFWTRKQPELVLALSRKVTIRPSWDNDLEIAW